MKSSCISLLVVFLIGICNTSVLSMGPDKITICHKQVCSGGDVHGNLPITLKITENALQSHLDHGDTVGACIGCEGEECDAWCEFDEDCDDNQVCNIQAGECVNTNESCNDVICDEGFACVHGQCFAVVINDKNDGNDGQNGSQGSSGSDGQDGVVGVDGEDGSSCTVITVGNCAAIHCDDGTEALVCNGQDGVSCVVEEVDKNVFISCPDGTYVTVGNTNFDDDNDGATNDIDQCPGTPQGFWVDEVGCMLIQKQPPLPNFEECDSVCGICGSGCELSLAMSFVGLAFLRKRGI